METALFIRVFNSLSKRSKATANLLYLYIDTHYSLIKSIFTAKNYALPPLVRHFFSLPKVTHQLFSSAPSHAGHYCAPTFRSAPLLTRFPLHRSSTIRAGASLAPPWIRWSCQMLRATSPFLISPLPT
jgi:hypothetical protein